MPQIGQTIGVCHRLFVTDYSLARYPNQSKYKSEKLLDCSGKTIARQLVEGQCYLHQGDFFGSDSKLCRHDDWLHWHFLRVLLFFEQSTGFAQRGNSYNRWHCWDSGVCAPRYFPQIRREMTWMGNRQARLDVRGWLREPCIWQYWRYCGFRKSSAKNPGSCR